MNNTSRRMIQGHACANGRQRLVADIVAYHDGVHRAVQLLHQASDEQRQGKSDDVPQGLPIGHVLGAGQAGELESMRGIS